MNALDNVFFDYVRVGFAVISCISCLANFVEYFALKCSRTFSSLMILFEQIGNLLICLSLTVLFFSFRNTICTVQSFILETGFFSATIWSLLSGFHVYLKYVRKRTDFSKYLVCWIVLGNVFPFVVSIILVDINGYDNIGHQVCWINIHKPKVLLIHVIYLSLNLLIQFILYFLILLKYYKRPTRSKSFSNLIIFLVTYAGLLAYCLSKILKKNTEIYWIHIEILILSLSGLFRTLTSKIFSSIREYLIQKSLNNFIANELNSIIK